MRQEISTILSAQLVELIITLHYATEAAHTQYNDTQQITQ